MRRDASARRIPKEGEREREREIIREVEIAPSWQSHASLARQPLGVAPRRSSRLVGVDVRGVVCVLATFPNELALLGVQVLHCNRAARTVSEAISYKSVACEQKPGTFTAQARFDNARLLQSNSCHFLA